MTKTLYKNIFWAVVMMFSLTLIFSILFETASKAEVLSINQLVSKINSGEVSKIIVQGNDLLIDLKDGKKPARKPRRGGKS